VEVARAVEPRLAVELRDVHHEGVALPGGARVAQPEVERALGMARAVGVDGPYRVADLVDDRQVARPVEHLKRPAAPNAARRPQREALAARVGRGAGAEVALAL